MIEEKLVWIRCEDLPTERLVREVLEDARQQNLFPSHVRCILSYGDEIEMMNPKEFLLQLEKIVDDLKITKR